MLIYIVYNRCHLYESKNYLPSSDGLTFAAKLILKNVNQLCECHPKHIVFVQSLDYMLNRHNDV